MDREFWKDTALRCAWTFAEAMLSCMTVGQAITEINWMHALSISAVAAIIAFLKQVVKLSKEDDDISFDDEADDIRDDIEVKD